MSHSARHLPGELRPNSPVLRWFLCASPRPGHRWSCCWRSEQAPTEQGGRMGVCMNTECSSQSTVTRCSIFTVLPRYPPPDIPPAQPLASAGWKAAAASRCSSLYRTVRNWGAALNASATAGWKHCCVFVLTCSRRTLQIRKCPTDLLQFSVWNPDDVVRKKTSLAGLDVELGVIHWASSPCSPWKRWSYWPARWTCARRWL